MKLFSIESSIAPVNMIASASAKIAGIMTLTMGIGYFIVWLIMYLRFRAKAKELNKYLEEDE